MTHTFAFVMDPLERVNVNTDTSFAFMLEACRRGHRVLHVPGPRGLSLRGDRVRICADHVEVAKKQGSHYRIVTAALCLEATDCDAIFIRTDPPFNVDYLTTTWLLSFAERQGVRVINSAAGIRSANEKLYALRFPELCPTTRVLAGRDEIRDFIDTVGGEAIGKPLDGHGGFGVVRLRSGDSNVHSLLDMLTLEGNRPIVVQQFLHDSGEGDRRLIVMDGELRGIVLRRPKEGDHRGNVHVGGTATLGEIRNSDQVVVSAMRDQLRADGLFFVGLDLIGDRLIEVNVTSPTLVQELRDLGGPDLAALMIDAAEGNPPST